VSAQERDPPSAPAGITPDRAGTLLRTAREAAGFSLDAVAQQLKLHPRQVRAMEDGDFAQLPGRTFVRGFVRNYARLLKLDADAVLAALPGGGDSAGLASPTLHATAPSIGELPVSQSSRPAWAKWAIPLTLVAIIAAGAAYEMLRPAAPPPTLAPASGEAREPVIGPRAPEPPPAPAAVTAGTTPPPVTAPSMPAPAPGAMPTGAAPVPPPGATTTSLPNPVAATPSAPASGVGDRELVLSFRDHSWTEVRERNGRVLLSAMMTPGARQVLSGQGPFELVIGNAADVSLTLDGKTVDLVPHTRQSVARLTLQ
jgi:cytoskeleton protein RodZ